jgi:hypothetical protein
LYARYLVVELPGRTNLRHNGQVRIASACAALLAGLPVVSLGALSAFAAFGCTPATGLSGLPLNTFLAFYAFALSSPLLAIAAVMCTGPLKRRRGASAVLLTLALPLYGAAVFMVVLSGQAWLGVPQVHYRALAQ